MASVINGNGDDRWIVCEERIFVSKVEDITNKSITYISTRSSFKTVKVCSFNYLPPQYFGTEIFRESKWRYSKVSINNNNRKERWIVSEIFSFVSGAEGAIYESTCITYPWKYSITLFGKLRVSAFSITSRSVKLFATINWAKSPVTLLDGVTLMISPNKRFAVA